MKNIANVIIILLFSMNHVLAEDNVLFIYQEADLSNHSESSEAIQKGIEVAFNEIDNRIGDYKIAFKYLDHRGNVIRSKRNYQKFLNDPQALVMYSGIHSAPLIKNRTYINKNKALTLVPWAAGGPITRYPSKENWVFRLSVDDTRAGAVIVDFAMKNQQCTKPHLLLEESPWGSSNLNSMGKALKNYDTNILRVTRFGWNLKANGAQILLNKIVDEGSDCILLVSNAMEGATIVKEMLNLSPIKRLPIISHWGITGGNFQNVVNAEMRKGLDLHFIQSCFAFTNKQQSILSKRVFTQLIKHSNGAISKTSDLKSAVGFIHAYDLTKLLIQAIKKIAISGDVLKDRNAIRLSLERINKPITGLVKTYKNPFSLFDEKKNINGHEALHKDDFCMGKFGANNEIFILKHKT